MNSKPAVPLSNDHEQRLAAGQACHLAALRYYQLGFLPTCLCDPQHIGVGQKHGKECANPGKVPIHTWKHYRNKPPSIGQIDHLWAKYPIGNVGIVLGQASGVVRIDVDNTTGADLLAEWSAGDLPPTWAFRSSPGCHGLLYSWPRDVECRSTAQQEKGEHKELRLLGNGSQTVMPPSRHPSGHLYTWEPGHAPGDIPLAPAPQWLMAWMCKKQPAPQRHEGADTEPDYAYVKEALDRIPNDDVSYDTWLTIGMALHATGSPWAKQVWDAWSQNSTKYDPDKQLKTWHSFSSEGGVTVGTLFYLAGMSRRESPSMYESQTKDAPQGDAGEAQDKSEKPSIVIDWDVTRFVDGGIEALMHQRCNLYQRDGILVYVIQVPRKAKTEHEDNPVVPRILAASDSYMVELATRAANWFKPDARKKSGYRQVSASFAFARHMRARPSWPFPILSGITTVPILRRDGTVVETPGYDDITGLYYQPAHDYSAVPDDPTWEDARDAYTALCEPFEDFPFVADYHTSGAISATLSIVARHLVKTAPLFPVRSNVAGSGKGLLVETAALIATGYKAAFWDEVLDPEEIRKQLLVIALDGDRVTCFDNLTRPLGAGPLDRAITHPYTKGRVLGYSQDVEVELSTVFFATGNGMTFVGDMARRVVPIDLSPQVERPEERTDFQHPNLLQWVGDEHPRLLVAALTLLKAYIQAGKPKQSIPPYGSFEEWSDLVRSALVWVGADDPCLAREGVQAENDTAYDDLRCLLRAWSACYLNTESKSLADVFDDIKYGKSGAIDDKGVIWNPGSYQKWTDLEAALDVYCRYEGGNPASKARSISRGLPVTKAGSRIIDGMRLIQDRDDHQKKHTWRVVDI